MASAFKTLKFLLVRKDYALKDLSIFWDFLMQIFQYSTEAYPEPSQTSKMELFAKIVNGFYPLTIFGKSFILDIWLGSVCAPRIYVNKYTDIILWKLSYDFFPWVRWQISHG